MEIPEFEPKAEDESERSITLLKWFAKVAMGAFVMTSAVSMGIWGASYYYKPKLTQAFPAPGRMVDVGGYEMHIQCMGQGEPTVVLEADHHDFSVQWAMVQPEVARYSRVCVYDRAGMGWSSPSPKPRTSSHMVDELHALLQNAGETAPYVMVGHFLGGLNARLYAHRFPQEVKGMVLLDAAHEDQHNNIPELEDASRKSALLFNVMQWAQKLGALAVTPEAIPDKGLNGEALQRYRAILATKHYFETAKDEADALPDSLKELQQAQMSDLGRMPLIVVSRGMKAEMPGLSTSQSGEFESRWNQLQQELAQLSTNSRQIRALRSGHYIHLSEPQLVVRAVREVLLQVRKQG
ncbi:MAG: alpha/beta hydrolase [Gammaproteobacteria bacterium]|nr:alpha/beta hydrolase [Gammaproteobacteria bacterium]MDH5803063.1 alpha/beta hydrolase [Gammaproteobacteria bacterium]